MHKSEFDQIVREHFDLSDKYTRHYIATLEDAGQEKLLNALSVALYNNIVSKVDDIDFGTIPMSRGDITKVEGFAGTEECLSTIRQLVTEYKQDTSVVDVVITAIQNVKDRKHIFTKAYALNTELPMLIYNLVVLSIVRSTSLMIATCVEYVKDPQTNTVKKALNKAAYSKSMEDVMFNQLISFNNLCKDKSLDKTLEAACKNLVKEDVEMQYDVVAPVNDDPVNQVVSDDDKEIDPQTTSDELFGNGEPEKATPEVDSMAGAHVSDDECGENFGSVDMSDECGGNCASAPVNAGDDVEIGIDIEDDDVEPDNIPQVVPGDATTDDDTSINELDIREGISFKGLDQAYNKAVDMYNKGAKKANVVKALVVLGAVLAPQFIKHILIPFIRNGVYGFYSTSMKFSDYLQVQADLIEANANELQYSDTGLSDTDKSKAVKKQLKFVEKLRKWSNAFNIDVKKTKNSVDKSTREDDMNKKRIAQDNNGDDALF